MHINLATKPAQLIQLPRYFADTVSIEANMDENIAHGTWWRCTEDLALRIEANLELKVIRGQDPDHDKHHEICSGIRQHAELPQDDPKNLLKWQARRKAIDDTDPAGWLGWLANAFREPVEGPLGDAEGSLLPEVEYVLPEASVAAVRPSVEREEIPEPPAESPKPIADGPCSW